MCEAAPSDPSHGTLDTRLGEVLETGADPGLGSQIFNVLSSSDGLACRERGVVSISNPGILQPPVSAWSPRSVPLRPEG